MLRSSERKRKLRREGIWRKSMVIARAVLIAEREKESEV